MSVARLDLHCLVSVRVVSTRLDFEFKSKCCFHSLKQLVNYFNFMTLKLALVPIKPTEPFHSPGFKPSRCLAFAGSSSGPTAGTACEWPLFRPVIGDSAKG